MTIGYSLPSELNVKIILTGHKPVVGFYAQGTDNFPTRVGIIGDLGQTFNSSSTLSHLTASNPPVQITV